MTKSNANLHGCNGNRPTSSTGPKTPEGKRHVKFNAVRHGFFADSILIGEPFRESAEHYKKFLEGLHDAIRPANALEAVLVERLALMFLRLSRVYKADARVIPLLVTRIEESLKEDRARVISEFIDKESEVALALKEPTPELLFRYESNLDRQIERILNLLERLQRMRKGQLVPAQINVEVS